MTEAASRDEACVAEERRNRLRLSLGDIRQIAPVIRGELPAPNEFRPIQVVDLSSDGFSFFDLAPPASDELAIVLGEPENPICLTASVVYTKTIERWGYEYLRVGCQFTGETKLNEYPSAPAIHADYRS